MAVITRSTKSGNTILRLRQDRCHRHLAADSLPQQQTSQVTVPFEYRRTFPAWGIEAVKLRSVMALRREQFAGLTGTEVTSAL
ncbi:MULTISPECIES: hypothetical protein [unclassified Schlesneria]|uniref:hypothetical protein n=1 Tax=unclassified Schlesneria TaxID=2762017 RepID=UPI002EFE812D